MANWPAVEAQLRARATQTNEPGRCALLLPVLVGLPRPLALLEVGAAAGLGLYPDRYAFRYGNRTIGSTGPVLDCSVTGRVPPARLPEVAGRSGPEPARRGRSGGCRLAGGVISGETKRTLA